MSNGLTTRLVNQSGFTYGGGSWLIGLDLEDARGDITSGAWVWIPLGSGDPCGVRHLWRQGAMRFLARILLAWGFWVQVSTLPELLDKAWYEVGPFETREQCEYVRAGAAWAGRLYRVIDPCIEWR
jgi:hypothetical protein